MIRRDKRIYLRYLTFFFWHYMLLMTGTLLIFGCEGNSKDRDSITSKSDNSPEDFVKPPTQLQNLKKELSLIMAGDALLHAAVYMDGKKEFKQKLVDSRPLLSTTNNLSESKVHIDSQNKIKNDSAATSTHVYEFSSMLTFIAPIISAHDLAFYNQESILGGTELGLSSYPTFNSPQEFGDSMLQAGFNLVSLANNHTLDKGQKGVNASLRYWNKQWREKKVLSAGSYESFDDRNTPRILEKNGITYTLLAYTYGTNGIPIPKGKEYMVNVYTKEMLHQDIANIRDKVDLLIVSMHWGMEYTFKPTQEQREMARLLANAGVDIVIGNHPHVIQPIEIINDCLIVYSLGNMLSAQKGLSRKIGMLVSLDIVKKESSPPNLDFVQINSLQDSQTADTAIPTTLFHKQVALKNIKVELIYTYHNEKRRDFKIIPFNKLNDTLLPNYKNIAKEYFNTIGLDTQKNITIGIQK